ncbi:hypothetical protein AB0M22_23825 [Nocardia sp. NPDC051756]|uniref:hypothetical protein n=1 Tax=Nocardia sp. NPDC051756 TaxID=3154751 RepID=UPI00343CCF60
MVKGTSGRIRCAYQSAVCAGDKTNGCAENSPDEHWSTRSVANELINHSVLPLLKQLHVHRHTVGAQAPTTDVIYAFRFGALERADCRRVGFVSHPTPLAGRDFGSYIVANWAIWAHWVSETPGR